MFRGAYLRREICVSKPIGLALVKSKFTVLLCSTLYLRAILQVQAPRGLYLEGRFNGGFFTLSVWGAYIWRGLFSEFYGMVNVKAVNCQRAASRHCEAAA